MRQWTGSSLVQVMACRLFGTKPLSQPMLVYCQLDSWEQTSVKFKSELYHFRSRKCIWNCRLPKWRPFCPGGDEFTDSGRCFQSTQRTLMITSHVNCNGILLNALRKWETFCWRQFQKYFSNHQNVFLCVYIENRSSLVQVMVQCRTDDEPLPEPMMTQFIDAYTHH